MNAMESTLSSSLALPGTRARTPRSARVVLALLERMEHGTLELRLPDGSQHRFGEAGHAPGHAQGHAHATLDVGAWSMFDSVVERGDVGFAEAWIAGDWHSPDLTALLTLLANNRESLAQAVYGQWWGLLSARLRHWFNANTRAGSRRNIMAHYDLGNDFYRQWLDPTMSYSSALYSSDAPRSMAAAQLAKYRRILSRLDSRPGQRVLEIGCGWGGFAETAAREAGLEVVGLTLSPAQLEFARERMQIAGLERQVTLELRDYRELAGEPFDHIVSIEMFEAVGERWWPTYFATLQRLLAPGGRAVVQSITIRDDLFARYRRGTDFVQQHVFPGGMLPSPSVFRRQAARAGLVVGDAFAFGRDYARTLAEWSANFEQRWPTIETQGFDERFRRLWCFYLAYCQAGFNSGCTDVLQVELAHAR
ncbi:cyclopropane-fatty-acyl-phospholipid synthase family protein [Accumulibacter sp.]|uniref:Cyclopropane-fatty-acyl-phospholipid synthase n=1 Tax=Accumulibacter regalis TaxID=522306 RepID=C7RMC5_ACCRE|nr:cyclopropane-fatty-acyl-phospholipid synthase family protein [Accumulibacter sp.]MBN8499094.1 class I SAM-dependent methyltransferase [Accumulibacter sp.]MBO3717152.1 class I SAM-dependent methyltransferase [Accumulibacter sp.]